MDINMKVSQKLYSLQQKIKELHGGSIENIRICLARYVDDQAYTDPRLMLKDIGMATEGPFTVYYDFGVQPRPLLTTPLKYGLVEDERWFKQASQLFISFVGKPSDLLKFLSSFCNLL